MVLVHTMKKGIYALFILLILGACKVQDEGIPAIRIAFLSDVHLQDVYGDFSDTEYKGLINPKNGKYATIRTMSSQLQSTRLFNENYFAFVAALDDIAERGVELVVLPGDFSDDGQMLNVRGLEEILEEYSEKYGMEFFLTTGNHDPVRPFLIHGGKKDFLGEGGKNQPVFSKEGLYVPGDKEHSPVISEDVAEMGYRGIVEMLGEYGFNPQADYLYWETPFSSYSYKDYSFSKANTEAAFENRFYEIPPAGFAVPDVSYLVEPVGGLWLLAIDANVYVPVEKPDNDPFNPKNYQGASLGYNNVLTHKKHLIHWVEKVAEQAELLDKQLVAFSHYPMVDFHNDASPEIQKLLGKGKLQTHRVPDEEVARIFADAGIKIHFAGHLHVNDTGVRKTGKGNTLVNVQIPSLAAYIPAYKLLTVHGAEKLEVETVVVDSVPRFNEFFELYRQEYAFLKENGAANIWNSEVLTSESYFEFTEWHLKELVRLRFGKSDWNHAFGRDLMQISGWDLLVLSQLEGKQEIESLAQFTEWKTKRPADLRKAEDRAEQLVKSENMEVNDFRDWHGADLLVDFYKLRSADELAFEDIGKDRLLQYGVISRQFTQINDSILLENSFSNHLKELAAIIVKFMDGEAADHFMLNLENGQITDLKQ